MRQRRGNYMILFAFLLPLMLGFLALAIDIGRIRVAAIQAEGAASSAALAALVEFREGRSLGAASATANIAAQQTRFQRTGSTSSGLEFNVEVTPGEWDWATQTWSADSSSNNSVTVNVAQRTPLGLLFASVFNAGGAFSGGAYNDGVTSGVTKTITVGKRAAMRPRDIVLVVDISRFATDEIEDVQDELRTFVTNVADYEIDLDRIGVVVYAGDAALHMGLEDLEDNVVAIRNEMDNVDLCSIDDESWYKFYRFYDTDYDQELGGSWTFDYFAVDTSPVWGGESHFGWDWNDDADTRDIYLDIVGFDDDLQADPGFVPYTEANWFIRDLLDEEICHASTTSWLLFTLFDPRIAPAGDRIDMHPDLFCHEGNYWEGRSDRFQQYIQIVEQDCSAGSPLMDWNGTSYDEDTDGNAGYEVPDRSFSFAGSNPGAGLGLAEAVLRTAAPSRAEPTVVLVTPVMPTCGPNLDSSRVNDCEDEFQLELFTAVSDLDELGANTHIVVYNPDVATEVFYEDLTTGRGNMYRQDDADGLTTALAEIAENIKLQVVE